MDQVNFVLQSLANLSIRYIQSRNECLKSSNHMCIVWYFALLRHFKLVHEEFR
jgi:hypothetical protein